MKLAMCPVCRVVHQAVGRKALIGADEDRAYRLTHCRLCKVSSSAFNPLPDGPNIGSDELGYPAAVVSWIDCDELPQIPMSQGKRENVGELTSRRSCGRKK